MCRRDDPFCTFLLKRLKNVIFYCEAKLCHSEEKRHKVAATKNLFKRSFASLRMTKQGYKDMNNP